MFLEILTYLNDSLKEEIIEKLDIKLLALSIRNTLGIKWDKRIGKQGVTSTIDAPNEITKHHDNTPEQ